MQKRLILLAAASALLLLSACGPAASSSAGSAAGSSSSSSADSSTQDVITPEDGAALLEQKFGKTDLQTGNTFSFGYEGPITLDGVNYYNYRISWLVDGDHLSYLTNYLVSTDGTVLKEYLPNSPDTVGAELESAADALLLSMRSGDFAAVAAWADPEQGVTFTPYSTVDFSHDRTVTAEELEQFPSDTAVYDWGVYDGSGEPIQLTCGEYWDKFVWNVDYTAAPTVTVDGMAGSGSAIENVTEAYPDASFVEYHFDQLDPQYGGLDWCSLKLVFVSRDGAWKLVGIIHSQWTI